MFTRTLASIAFLFAITSNLCTAANALGSDNRAMNLKARDEWQPNATSFVCFFLTSDVNWQGEQQNLCSIGGQCANQLPDGLASNISSAGPTDGQTCFLYTDENCSGNSSAAISYPGYADLSGIGFLKKARSWRCYKWCGYHGPASTTTTTTLVTLTKTMHPSAAIAKAKTNRDVSITTTLSATPSTTSTTSSTVAISTTQSTSASASSVRASALSPGPTPISESPSSSSTVAVSTTLTSGTSSSAPITSPHPWSRVLPLLSASTAHIGTGNASASSSTTLYFTKLHTYGGMGSNWTTLITVAVVEPVPSGATAAPIPKK